MKSVIKKYNSKILILTFIILFGSSITILAKNFDFNNDSIINDLDMNYIKDNFNGTSSEYDLNSDGIVDIYDASKLAQKYSEENVIVLDPGHNIKSIYGIDTGARYTHKGKTYIEEILNMQITLKLKSELELLGYKVLLTQEPNTVATDKTVKDSLIRRVNFANANNPIMMISIHHNSGPTSVSGTEVYYSSSRNNQVNNSIITKSKELGAGLSSVIANSGNFKNRGIKDGNLYVTKNTNMLSVLAEIGFLSNESEAVKVADPKVQLKVAKAMANYIDEFLKKNLK